jgi:tRNA (cytidine/uridine-2'-O-)-methyltransferase
VRPLGFSLSSKYLKRAGLDYWDSLNLRIVDSLEELLEDRPFYFFSSKATRPYSSISFEPNALLIFGSETAGLPDSYRTRWPTHFYTIPMAPQSRSLNLSTAVAIVHYESLRQRNFPGLR